MPSPMTFDVTTALDIPLLVPALLVALALFADNILTLRFPSLVYRWFPLLYLGRILIPLSLLVWIMDQHSGIVERLGVRWPESPWAIMENVGAAAILFVLSFGFWKWVQPGEGHLDTITRALPVGGLMGWILAGGEAMAHQVGFALFRAVARTPTVTWGLVIALGVLFIGADLAFAKDKAAPPSTRTILLLVGLFGGTGLVLGGYSLWAAIFWYWGLVALGRSRESKV